MIPMLLLYLTRKLKEADFLSNKKSYLKRFILKLKVLLFLFISTMTYGLNTEPLNHLVFSVLKNNKVIGIININRDELGDSVTYSLKSDIDVSYVLKFNATGQETAIYKNGILVYSSIYRKLNGKVKANHRISFEAGKYHLDDSSKNQTLKLGAISKNLITLYFNEPIGIEEVFCDNLKEMVGVIPLGDGKYRVNFTKDKYNIFHYKNGRCVKIEAKSALFNVTLKPV